MYWKLILFSFVMLVGSSVFAQEFEQDPVEERLFAPELVMKYQQAIKLTEEQRTAFKKEIQLAQSKFTDYEWDLQNEMEIFVSLLDKNKIDEQEAIEQLEKILGLEWNIKQTHLVLAIRIKNLLTTKQQNSLLLYRNANIITK